MNNYQNAQVNMFEAVKLFFAENNALLITFVPLGTAISTFNGLVTNLTQAIQRQDKPITGITGDKNLAIDNLIEYIVPKSRLAYAWAVTTYSNEAADIFNVRVGELDDLPENDLIARAQNIKNAMNTHLAALADYEITLAVVSEIQNRITSLQNLIGTPEGAIGARETATDAIAALIKDCTSVLEVTDDLISGRFGDTNPELVLTYRNVRKIVNTGVRHTGLRATVKDAVTNALLENVLVKVVEVNREALSNINGFAEILKFKAGTYHVEVSKAGYVTQTMVLKITRGEILEINVALQGV